MSKNTLNIAAVCVFVLIIVFSITQKNNIVGKFSDNILVDENGKIMTKADKYQENILATVAEENIKNFQKFSKSFEKKSSDNLSDILSKDIFTQYIKYNTSGEINEKDINNITDNILKTKVEIENPVRINQIKTSASNIESLKIYGTNIAIVQEALNKGLAGITTKKDRTPYVIAAYRGTAQILSQTKTPDMLADNHLLIINGYVKYYEGLQMLQYQESDPAKALLGLNKIQSATSDITNGFEKIRKTIILNKVEYSENDPGKIWTTSDNNTTIKVE